MMLHQLVSPKTGWALNITRLGFQLRQVQAALILKKFLLNPSTGIVLSNFIVVIILKIRIWAFGFENLHIPDTTRIKLCFTVVQWENQAEVPVEKFWLSASRQAAL